MFNIQLIQDAIDEEDKWIVWKRNIGEKYFANIILFKDNVIKKWLDFQHVESWLLNSFKLFTEEESKKHGLEKDWHSKSAIRKEDVFRKFTPYEYINLSLVLTKMGYKYNKKKDEFIKL